MRGGGALRIGPSIVSAVPDFPILRSLDLRSICDRFPALQPAGQAAGVPGSDSGPVEAGREPETAPSVSPEGRYLTFQGLASVPALRPVISVNHEWTTRHPLHITASLHFEMGGPPADPAFRGEKIGLGAKAGVRKYFLGKQGWYLEGDLGGFHFFNGMLGGNRSYFGTGPHLGYKTRIEQVVLDANIGWMHVFNEPQVYPGLQGTGEEVIDRHLRILEWTSGWSIRNAYPLMRFEANFALGFKF